LSTKFLTFLARTSRQARCRRADVQKALGTLARIAKRLIGANRLSIARIQRRITALVNVPVTHTTGPVHRVRAEVHETVAAPTRETTGATVFLVVIDG